MFKQVGFKIFHKIGVEAYSYLIVFVSSVTYPRSKRVKPSTTETVLYSFKIRTCGNYVAAGEEGRRREEGGGKKEGKRREGGGEK